MLTILKAFLAMAVILYPLLIYFSFSSQFFHYGVAAMATVFVGRAILSARQVKTGQESAKADKVSPLANVGIYVAIIGIFVCVGYFAFRQLEWMLYYPVLVNLTLFFVFFRSLWVKPAIVTSFARQFEKDFPEEHVPYTEKVTLVWTVFFVINGAISLATILFYSVEVWTLYNGLLSYLFIGLLMLVELAYRKWLLT